MSCAKWHKYGSDEICRHCGLRYAWWASKQCPAPIDEVVRSELPDVLSLIAQCDISAARDIRAQLGWKW